MDDHDLLMDAVTDQAMRTKNRIQGSWAWGGLSLLAGGYLVGGFGGALIAFGALWIALAVASEITARICPIAMWVTAGPIRRYDEQVCGLAGIDGKCSSLIFSELRVEL
jgi:hypothetical protein